jgi:Mg-chelatase subunit ChlD
MTSNTNTTQNIDLAISFDTTGSMYPCLSQVRRNIDRLVKELFAMTSGLRIAIIAHGDYCDAATTYVTKILDFTSDINTISKFVNTVEQTGGGDAPECYELVLNKARSLAWRSGKSKVLLMIGDNVPHGPSYPGNKQHIDWRNELGLLLEAGINVYGMHAMPGCRTHSRQFYEEIARKTGGFYITLDQFSSIGDIITAVAAKQESDITLQTYADTVKSSGRMTKNMSNVFGTLLGRRIDDWFPTTPRSDSLIPVASGRFQVMRVDDESVIMNFVQDQGISFEKGRGFYQLTKSEKVQGYKEIILMDKTTGELFNGPQVRNILGLTEGLEGRLSSKSLLDKFNIFVQSTSYNRKLQPNTLFLYEVSDWEK